MMMMMVVLVLVLVMAAHPRRGQLVESMKMRMIEEVLIASAHRIVQLTPDRAGRGAAAAGHGLPSSLAAALCDLKEVERPARDTPSAYR